MKSVQFSKVSSIKRSKSKVTTKVSGNRLNIAKRSYGLSKTQTFFKRVERLAFTVINYIRELIAQKLYDSGIHFLDARKFCRRPTSKVSASEQSRCSTSVERAVLVYVHPKRVNTV